ncbi:hypothetical protein AIOL_003979 [Candidatus Rhodobacter oscarellae]|uniref:Uncharacterized protein n=1 Tax=Candidatus Rhodobacter oscarellae TaxID=1675527 RepID=A0A0J9GZS9_9RHOB|nr:hypothetical protein [Candidatus Rhodobacter lobularis]KMW58998.1 hypothetical protein AIOL_003979 [Candidatus Rhodobacter lobularis]
MTRITLIAAALTSLTLTAPASFAGNAGASLPDCYNHVINACNGTNHPEACSESGMNACDEYHNANAANGVGAKLKLLSNGNGRFKVKIVPQRAAPPAKVFKKTGETPSAVIGKI